MSKSIIKIIETGEQIEIDAVVSLDDSTNNTLTKYPVENGSVITENVSTENPVIDLQGIISNATIQKANVSIEEKTLPLSRSIITRNYSLAKEYSVKVNKKDAEDNAKVTRRDDSRDFLKYILSSKKLLLLKNGDDLYENLVMTSLSFRKDSRVGVDALFFDCKLERINIATVKTTQREVDSPFAGTDNDGDNPAKKVTSPEAEENVTSNPTLGVKVYNVIKGG